VSTAKGFAPELQVVTAGLKAETPLMVSRVDPGMPANADREIAVAYDPEGGSADAQNQRADDQHVEQAALHAAHFNLDERPTHSLSAIDNDKMRRVRRYVFKMLAAISLLLGAFVLVLWPLSYSTVLREHGWCMVPVRPGDSEIDFGSSKGGLELSWNSHSRDEIAHFQRHDDAAERRWVSQYPHMVVDWHGFGFGNCAYLVYGTDDYVGYHGVSRWVSFPHWLAASVIFMVPAMWWATRKSRNAQRGGHCKRCGYDLRATPQRCPECGAIAAAGAPASA
jgi:hypothetical protein